MATSSLYRDLLDHCIEILTSYDAETTGVDSHAEHYVSAYLSVATLEESSVTLVTEVFAGCVQYSKLMQVVIDIFYAREGRNFKRHDAYVFKVLAYLAIFRLEELGMAHFRRFVNTQPTNKMYKFLKFLFDEENVQTLLNDKWCKVYDRTFVHTHVVSSLLRWYPEAQELVKQLHDKLMNVQKARSIQPPTEVKSFQLTKPRPRTVLMPDKIPKLKPRKPVPISTYQAPTTVQLIAKAKESNKERAKALMEEATQNQFACATVSDSDRKKQTLQKIQEEEDAKLDFNRSKMQALPSSNFETTPIKLNTAAILREGIFFRRQEEEKLRKLEELVSGSRDASEFLRWQEQNKQQELQAQMAEIERKHLEGQLSHEEAIIARRSLAEENRVKVQEMKQEADRLMQLYLQRRLEEEQGMRMLVEQILSGHQNARKAKQRVKEIKQKIVKEVAKEKQELMQRALEEAEAEMKRKVELIQQIRALESVPIVRSKFFDMTATSGQGLLCEMSVAELRERLAHLKVAQEEEEERRRKDIVAAKQVKDQLVMDTLDQIAIQRAEQARLAAARQEQLRQEAQQRAAATVNDPHLQRLQQRLADRRSQRQRLASDPNSPSRMTAGQLPGSSAKKTQEQRRWQDLERSQERSARLLAAGKSAKASGVSAERFPRISSPTAS
ncbi:cilia- and flagella-associated protein 99-like [Corticium candelabrum]|uniref:cilia- and flagella-associated protein 99-like n=1 Tax=Corticium candelabrum TaxID=121492 RepID=UPI002E26C033|nr:cilia- and flagella-associated protein 99-like [Corticium candelabrum]